MPLSTEDALRAYCRMLNSHCVDAIESLLAEDFRYESQMVLKPLVSRAEFLQYIHPKLETIARSGAAVFAEMGSIDAGRGRQPCAILAQGDRSNLVGFVLAEVAADKITRLDLCIVPAPECATRTGEYPAMPE